MVFHGVGFVLYHFGVSCIYFNGFQTTTPHYRVSPAIRVPYPPLSLAMASPPPEILVPTIRIYDNVRGWENPSARLLITAKIKYVMYLTSLAAHKGILFTANKSVMDTKTRPSTARYRVIPIFKNAPATSTSSYRPGFSPVFFV